ncbi:hypothetical protein GE061_012807 [Apolygus lucorum]|uniref:Uncharacterized protein n=1 Tax=Apolygus lucorum TaxID=248454 RepID=A0A8S9XXE8_APOLU|nr:hypothetical protein GE061_012807 [Apolygus lucorum]
MRDSGDHFDRRHEACLRASRSHLWKYGVVTSPIPLLNGTLIIVMECLPSLLRLESDEVSRAGRGGRSPEWETFLLVEGLQSGSSYKRLLHLQPLIHSSAIATVLVIFFKTNHIFQGNK